MFNKRLRNNTIHLITHELTKIEQGVVKEILDYLMDTKTLPTKDDGVDIWVNMESLVKEVNKLYEKYGISNNS